MLTEDAIKIFQRYLSYFPDEVNDFSILQAHFAHHKNLLTRQNRAGHITGSGIVLLENKILLIWHNTLQRFLQPGGHFEDDASISACAKREVEEETGLKPSLHAWHDKTEIPIHIDSHVIPPNEKKNEPEHYHHDFLYVFEAMRGDTLSLQKEEVRDAKWIEMDDAFKDRALRKIAQKMRTLHL